MKVNLYAIHDAKATAYMPPFPMTTHGLAQRSFIEACLNPESNFHKYPLDYTLFFIGVYDDETSIIKSECPPEMLMTANQAMMIAEREIQNAITDKKDQQNSIGEMINEISNDE